MKGTLLHTLVDATNNVLFFAVPPSIEIKLTAHLESLHVVTLHPRIFSWYSTPAADPNVLIDLPTHPLAIVLTLHHKSSYLDQTKAAHKEHHH